MLGVVSCTDDLQTGEVETDGPGTSWPSCPAYLENSREIRDLILTSKVDDIRRMRVEIVFWPPHAWAPVHALTKKQCTE